MRFNSSYNVIVGPIDMPCSGTGSAGPWTAGACGNSEIWGWVSWVEDWARTVSIKAWQPSMHVCRWAVLGKACEAPSHAQGNSGSSAGEKRTLELQPTALHAASTAIVGICALVCMHASQHM